MTPLLQARVSPACWQGKGGECTIEYFPLGLALVVNAPPTVHEVRNKVLVIIGLGTIGKKVARLAKAFGMVVHYYDIKRLKEEEEDALGVRFRLLPEILRHSDIVSLHVPLNASTQGMLGAQELAAMTPSAIIVNTSRGPVIDEKAMTAALSAGKLFGAGLDVFDEEPTPPDNPLLKLDNVVLTAHLAGPTFESNITRLRNGFDNVQRVARGEPADVPRNRPAVALRCRA